MTSNYTGGCACGAIRFDVSGEPIAMVDCQCRDCQRRSGTGHGSYMTFASRKTAKVTGEGKIWEVVGEGGTVKHHAFCPACGTPAYLVFPAAPDIFIVHAASLDDPARYKPQFVTWTHSAHPWDFMDPDVPKFEKMPPQAG